MTHRTTSFSLTEAVQEGLLGVKSCRSRQVAQRMRGYVRFPGSGCRRRMSLPPILRRGSTSRLNPLGFGWFGRRRWGGRVAGGKAAASARVSFPQNGVARALFRCACMKKTKAGIFGSALTIAAADHCVLTVEWPHHQAPSALMPMKCKPIANRLQRLVGNRFRDGVILIRRASPGMLQEVIQSGHLHDRRVRIRFESGTNGRQIFL